MVLVLVLVLVLALEPLLENDLHDLKVVWVDNAARELARDLPAKDNNNGRSVRLTKHNTIKRVTEKPGAVCTGFFLCPSLFF